MDAIDAMKKMSWFWHRTLIDIQFKNPKKKWVNQWHRILVSVLEINGKYYFMANDQSNSKYDDWEKNFLEFYRSSGYLGNDLTITNRIYNLSEDVKKNIGEKKPALAH